MVEDVVLLERIKRLVAEERSVRMNSLHLETSLNDDLGMDGDDAVEFFEKFGDEFHVDLSNMPWDEYFGPEGVEPLGMILLPFRLLAWLVSRLARLCGALFGKAWALDVFNKDKTRPVTIRDLLCAAELKRWPESETEP